MNNLQRVYRDENSEVFLFSIDENLSMLDISIIPKEELEKILRYKEDIDRIKRLLARTFLFEYCQQHYNLKDFTFKYTKNQKPQYKYNDSIDFSISYSKDIIVVALSTKYRVGVDIEFIDTSIVLKEIASEFMNKIQLTKFMQLDKIDKDKYFYEIWTSKESLLKAQGNGLLIDPKDIVNDEGKLIYFKDYVINLSLC